MIKKVIIKGYRKFKDFKFEPEDGMNIVVGDNESGKSTLFEAIIMALTGRIDGVRASEAINPYMFNKDNVENFFKNKELKNLPEFLIEVYLNAGDGDIQRLRGANNSLQEDSVGLSVHAYFDLDYEKEIKDYFEQHDCPNIIPTEYYRVDWTDFSGRSIFKKPKDLGVMLIDSSNIISNKYANYNTRNIINSHIDTKDNNKITSEYRSRCSNLAAQQISEINEKLEEYYKEEKEWTIGLQPDQSNSSSWWNIFTPCVDNIPLNFIGQGYQACSKTVLTFSQKSDKSNYIFMEEPENHLSYSTLRKLLYFIEDNYSEKQIFISTHSSYVLNRMGLDKISLINNGRISKFSNLNLDTVEYFKKLSGFNTLRILLSKKAVIVEGPSDEIVFNKFFKDTYGKEPLDCGIDVIAINGVAFRRCLELADILFKDIVVLRDNDNKNPEEWKEKLCKNMLNDYKNKIFIGKVNDGNTLETQIINANSNNKEKLKKILNYSESDDNDNIANFMINNKTDSALLIAESDEKLNQPSYIKNAIRSLMEIANQSNNK